MNVSFVFRKHFFFISFYEIIHLCGKEKFIAVGSTKLPIKLFLISVGKQTSHGDDDIFIFGLVQTQCVPYGRKAKKKIVLF